MYLQRILLCVAARTQLVIEPREIGKVLKVDKVVGFLSHFLVQGFHMFIENGDGLILLGWFNN